MAQRTYWHLEGRGRVPSDYEIVTSRLLYYPERGFEVASPVAGWCNEQQTHAALQSPDWDEFCDPRETTYSSYVARAQAREAFIDGLLEFAENTDYDGKLSQEWLQTLDAVVPVLRFPVHGLQMASAYIGSMAPSGRIAVATLFQAADEMRLVQRLAYRTRQLQYRWPKFGENSRKAWEGSSPWQPIRRAIEQLLVTYDWTVALLVSSLVIKPVLRELFLIQFPKLAAAAGDEILEKVLIQLGDDQSWHDAWSAALLSRVCQTAENRERAAAVIVSQRQAVVGIVDQVVQMFDALKPSGVAFDSESAKSAVQVALLQRQQVIGLQY